MSGKIKKALLYLMTAFSVVCIAFGILLSKNHDEIVSAEVVPGGIPLLSETKVLKSSDGTMMLLATGINNYQDCYECGYETVGLKEVTYNRAKYYTSISTKGGKSWSAEDIFGSGYDGMIVWEVKNESTETSFKPYVKVGEREGGVLYPTEPVTTIYGANRELVGKAAIPDSADKPIVLDGLSDYGADVATIEFNVHLAGASDELLFNLADNLGNYYGTYRINNTLAGFDTSGSFNHAGVTCEVLGGSNNYHIVVTLVDLIGGSITAPTAITKLSVVDSAAGVSTSLTSGSSIENIDFEYCSVLMVGDVHIGKSVAALNYFRETMEYVRDNGIKVVIFNGDFVHYGDEDTYDAADEILEDVFDGYTTDDLPEFIFNMGNHEFYPNSGCNYLETDYETSLSLFRTFVNKWMKTPIGESDNIYSRKIGGINYIVAWSSKTGNTAGDEFTSADFTKLGTLLATATAGDAPCVLLTHCPWGYTYGADSDTPSASVVSSMTTLLASYPSVINVTSHTHFSALHERTLDQTNYTTVALGPQVDEFYVSGLEYDENTSILTYSNINNTYKNYFVNDGQATSYYEQKHFGFNFTFGSSNVIIKRVNLSSGEDYEYGTWTIPYGITSSNKSSKFYYESSERSGETLSFGVGAEIGVSLASKPDTDVMKFTVSFPDVEKYYAVEGYKIEIYDENDTLVKNAKWLSLFWADVGNKSNYEAVLSDVPVSAEYTIKVYPIDFFGVYNDPLIKEIITAEETIDEHPDAIEISAPYTYNPIGFGISNFKDSGKAFTFDYKKSGADGSNTILFTLWTSSWNPRITELITINVVENTISGATGYIKDIGNGWHKVTINCSDIPVNTASATGNETVGLLYFNTVNHAFYLDNVGFIDEISAYTVSVTNGTGGGSYYEGESVTVIANTAPASSIFVEWQVGGERVSTDTSYTFTVEDDISLTAVYATQVSAAKMMSDFDTPVLNFASSGKALTFKYKKTGADGTNTILLSLWGGAGGTWSPRLTDTITVDVVANTVSIGQIKSIGDGWYKVTINLDDMPLNTGTADGTETARKLYFNTVNHSFYVYDTGFTDEIEKFTVSVEDGTGDGSYYKGAQATVVASVPNGKLFVEWQVGGERVSTDASYTFTVDGDVTVSAIFKDDPHDGAKEFTSSNAWKDGTVNYYFVTPSDSKVIDPATDTIIFDVKFTSDSGFLQFYLNEYYYGRWCGPFKLTTAGVLTGTGATKMDLGDGWYRITIDLASTAQSATVPAYVSRINLASTSADGYIKYMGLDSHAGAKEFTSSNAWKDGTVNNYFVSPSNSKVIDPATDTAIFDVFFTSNSGQLQFYLNEYYYGRYCGPFIITSAGVLTGEGATLTVLDGVDEGWYRITIDLASTVQSATAPNFVSRINLVSTTANGYIKYMGLKPFTVTVENGTGGGTYDKGSEATVVASVPDGKLFKEWQVGGEAVSTDSSYTFTVTNNITLTAIFKDDPHLGADTFAASTASSISIDSVSVAKTMLIDVKITDETNQKVTLLLKQGATAKYYGYYAVFKSGALGGTYPGVSVSALEDGWLQIKINLAAATATGSPTYIDKIEVATYTTGNGYIMYMGVETCAISVTGGTGGGTYDKGTSATVTANGNLSQFIGWKNGSGDWISNEISYTFTITDDAVLTAIYGPINLTSGFDILIPDYEVSYESILVLSLDVYVPNNDAKVYFGLYDGSGNYYGKYGVSYTGLLLEGCSTSGVAVETLVANRKFRLTFTLDNLVAGSGTPGKIVKIKDIVSVSITGSTIGNIAFSYLTVSANAVLRLDYADNTEQILKTASAPVSRQTTVKFAGAIGERETAQLTMYAIANISGKEFDVFFTDFKGASGIIPASAVETSILQYINVDSNFVVTFGYDTLSTGYYADALLPLSVAKAAGENTLTVSNGNNQGLFLILNIPSTAVKGNYYGNVIITVEDNDPMCLPVQIEVYGFALPEESAAKTSVGVRMDLINDLYEKTNNDSSNDCDYYDEVSEFLQERGVNVATLRGGVWSNGTIDRYINKLKIAAADPNVTSYQLDYNWNSYGNFKVSGTIYNDQTGSSTTLSKKNIGSVSLPRMENITSGNITYYGLKAVLERLATESTNEVDLFKKAYIYSLYDEVDGETEIKILLNMYVWYTARDYVLTNFDWTGKLSVKASLENLHYVAADLPFDTLYRGVTITVNSYDSATFSETGTADNCGIPTNTALSLKMDGFMTEPVKFDQTGPYATGGTNSTRNRSVNNGVAIIENGDYVWWYIAVGCDPYWASFAVNASTLNNRINYWQMFKLGIEGMYHWNATLTESYISNGSGGWKFQEYDATWFNTQYGLSSSQYSALTTMEKAAYIERYYLANGLTYQGQYGDGMLIYLVSATYGEYGADFLSTIRLETIAEATDDYNYLAYAQSLIDGIGNAGTKATYQANLDDLFDELFTNDGGSGKFTTKGFTADNGEFKTTRAALAALIEELLAL